MTTTPKDLFALFHSLPLFLVLAASSFPTCDVLALRRSPFIPHYIVFISLHSSLVRHTSLEFCSSFAWCPDIQSSLAVEGHSCESKILFPDHQISLVRISSSFFRSLSILSFVDSAVLGSFLAVGSFEQQPSIASFWPWTLTVPYRVSLERRIGCT